MLPKAYVYPAEMRATRDLLRICLEIKCPFYAFALRAALRCW
jgi:hypothetical protein